MTITFKQLKAEVLRLAAEHPEAVYTQSFNDPTGRACFYTKGACGPGVGCIFGQALVNLDPTLCIRLRRVDNEDDNSGIFHIATMLGVFITQEELVICSLVQKNQDNGEPWGDAVKAFKDN